MGQGTKSVLVVDSYVRYCSVPEVDEKSQKVSHFAMTPSRELAL